MSDETCFHCEQKVITINDALVHYTTGSQLCDGGKTFAQTLSQVRVWCIGSDGTEYYAAFSEKQMRAYYVRLVGREQAAEDLHKYFHEVPQSAMDEPFEMDFDGEKRMTTWRKQIANAHLPCQISTGYN